MLKVTSCSHSRCVRYVRDGFQGFFLIHEDKEAFWWTLHDPLEKLSCPGPMADADENSFLICVGLNHWKNQFLSVLLQITAPTHWYTHRYCKVIISLKMKFFVRYFIVLTDPEQIHSQTRVHYTAPGNSSQDKFVWKVSKSEPQICKALLPEHLNICLQVHVLPICRTVAVKSDTCPPHVQPLPSSFAAAKALNPSLHAAQALSTRPCCRWKGWDRVWSIGTGGGRRKAKDKGEICAIWSAEMKMSKSSSLKCTRIKGTGAPFGVLVCLLFRTKLQRTGGKKNPPFASFYLRTECRQQGSYLPLI